MSGFQTDNLRMIHCQNPNLVAFNGTHEDTEDFSFSAHEAVL